MDPLLTNKPTGTNHVETGEPVDVPRKLGSQEETELYLRSVVNARRSGQLEYPAKDQFVPTAPEVFVVRWVNYQPRFGFGFQLSNGVFGVICNDRTTVVLAPNGGDVEIIHGTEPTTTPPVKEESEQKRRLHADIDDAPSPQTANELDTYDKLDDEEYLRTMARTYCRMSDFPTLFKKNVMLLTAFKKYMLTCMGDANLLSFLDMDLRRNITFMTDIFAKVHLVFRLSNGITQVNYADHSKIILSERGRVVTFVDNDTICRRITMTTHQAFSAEFFYDLEDPKDQDRTVQEELKDINQARRIQGAHDLHLDIRNRHKDGHHYDDGKREENTPETRPKFDFERDTELFLLPRPNLAGQVARALQDTLLSTKAMLTAGQDASQIEERLITKDDKRVLICRMTFKLLHEEIVLRLRIAQRLIRGRAIELANDRLLKEEKERARPRKRRRNDNRHHRDSRQFPLTKKSLEAKESQAKEEGGGRGEVTVIVKTDPDGVIPVVERTDNLSLLDHDELGEQHAWPQRRRNGGYESEVGRQTDEWFL